MAIAYSFNGGAEISGVESDWQRTVIRTDTDGVIAYNAWALNTWRLLKMPGGTADALRVKIGQALASLETNDIDDRDSGVTYTTVILRSITGAPKGIYLENAVIEFMVKVS